MSSFSASRLSTREGQRLDSDKRTSHCVRSTSKREAEPHTFSLSRCSLPPPSRASPHRRSHLSHHQFLLLDACRLLHGLRTMLLLSTDLIDQSRLGTRICRSISTGEQNQSGSSKASRGCTYLQCSMSNCLGSQLPARTHACVCSS